MRYNLSYCWASLRSHVTPRFSKLSWHELKVRGVQLASESFLLRLRLDVTALVRE